MRTANINAEETKRRKARELRYRKPIVRTINLDYIKEDLGDISCACDEVRYYFESDDDTLINALNGNEDEAYEFKMMFADLCAECDQMYEDLNDGWHYIPNCFDAFFVALGGGEFGGGLLGFDSYEQDYFGLDCSDSFAEDESKKKLMSLTKDQLIGNARHCFKIYHSYLGIRHRYDCLKAAMDILRDQNTGYLQMIKHIEEKYEEADKEDFDEWRPATKAFTRMTEAIPQEAWIQ